LTSKHFPNFILAGPGKAGTTAIYFMLRQHPQIFLPDVKEPRFLAYENEPPQYTGPIIDKLFNDSTITNLEDYVKLYSNTGGAAAVGDASPIYMHIPRSVETTMKYIPDAKIIILLRHPAERAFSAYMHFVRDGYEKLSFRDSLLEEKERSSQNWGISWRYSQLGFIADQIERYLNAFGRAQISFVRYEDFRRDNVQTLQRIFAFLGVAEDFKPMLVNTNVGGVVKKLELYKLIFPIRFLRWLEPILPPKYRKVTTVWRLNMRSKTVIKPELPLEQLQALTRMYEKDILRTASLTGHDLSDWLNKNRKYNGE
jgi:hypothetical protein